MIVLHQFPPAFARIGASPFCLKLESWLRLTGLPYRSEAVRDLTAAPKGKAPFIDDGDRRIGDSALIIEHLKASRGVDPDAWLTLAQRGIARAVGLMLEDHLYFIAGHDRWLEPRNWPVTRDAVLHGMPRELQEAVQAEIRQALHAQGLGRHSRDELYALGIADIEALADVLGDKPFLMGDRPATVDCIAFAFVHNLMGPAFDGPLQRAVRACTNLVAHEARMRRRLFGAAAATPASTAARPAA